MLAHQGARAGSSRASFVGGVSPPPVRVFESTKRPGSFEKNGALNDSPAPPGRPGWKYAYEDVLWSKQKLPLKLRAILQVLLRLSDHLGRVWWSQPAIAELAGCTVRTLRRLLPALEASGYARIEPMTFRQLALAQAALGLPLPGRNDDGQAPDLVTLLVDGKPATDLRPTVRRRSSAPGQTVQGSPRTSLSTESPENVSEPADNMSSDPRDLSVDLYRNGGDPISPAHPIKPVLARCGTTPAFTNAQANEHAWLVLQAAYEHHYRRVYHAKPTNKPLPIESRMLMADHLADMATLLQARFVERNVDVTQLEKPPVDLLADEALRVWFDSSGANDYLRRVSHRMSALPADLPYRVRKAIEALLERLAPKPEPRKVITPVLPLAQMVGRPVSEDTLIRAPRPAPASNIPSPPKPTIAKTNLSSDVLQVLEGLSQHASLVDLAQTPTLAVELVTIAQDRGAAIAQLLEVLELVATVCQRQRTASTAARSGIVYKFVLEHFNTAPPRCSTPRDDNF